MTIEHRPQTEQQGVIASEAPQLTPKPDSLLKTDSFEVLTGRSNPDLAQEIADILAMDIDEPVTLFADGESRIKIGPNVRRQEVYILQSTGQTDGISQNDNIVDLLFMIRAAKRASASEITAVIPYFGYARQDRKDQPRVTISGADIADFIEFAGADRILTLDLHAEQMQGNLDIPWDNLYGSAALLPEIRKTDTSNLIVVSPDVGGTKRAVKTSHLLTGSGDIAIVVKDRPRANESEPLALIGDVKDKDVIMVDDIADTFGTMANAAKLLKEEGAKSIRAAVTHGLFNGAALDRLTEAPIDEMLTTDSVWLRPEVRNHPKIKVVSVAPLLADAVKRIHTGDSLSALIPTSKK